MRTFILFLFVTLAASCFAQFPVVVYNSSGANINVRATPSTSGTFLCTVAPGKRLVAISQSGSWYEVYIPINGISSPTTAWVSAGTGYMLPDNSAAQVQLTGTNVLIRKTAGGTGNSGTLWVYYPGYTYEFASTAIGQRYYPTGNTQSVSGTTWYEIDVPRSCYQCNNGSCSVASDFSIVTNGWISSQYLSYITPCSYTISPTAQTYSSTATNGSFGVNAGNGCSWQASVSCGWVTLTNSSGSGNGTVSFSVDENTSSTSRTCTITVAGQSYTITQSGAAPCTYTISPTNQNHTVTGGNGSIQLTTGASCQWSATVSCSWVHLTNTTGTGGGNITYTVDANTFSNSRTCFIVVNSQTFTVTQDGTGSNCTYTLSPTTNTCTSAPGSATFNVTVSSSFCTWTATESCPWVTLNNSSGSGNGTVSFSYDANPLTTTRTCNIDVNGQTFTITQQGNIIAGCNEVPPVITSSGCALAVPYYANANYEWQWNGQTQQSGASRFFTVTSITGSGYYTCIVTIGNCTYYSNDLYVQYATPCVVGLEETTLTNFSISPNPSSGTFTISLETATPETIGLKVFDVLGQLVKEEPTIPASGTYTRQITLTPTSKGIYLLQLSISGKIISKQIVIQ